VEESTLEFLKVSVRREHPLYSVTTLSSQKRGNTLTPLSDNSGSREGPSTIR
jgi:hypothetical protein